LEGDHGFEFLDDSFSGEFFGDIDTDESPFNILMGSRRFIEGWNCYRVSTIGLLNMGKSKGSQIIQLFGRGVRLKGYNNLMKRTKALVEEQLIDAAIIPSNIGLLETLNIFGIKADYVDTFKKQLEEEGIFEEEVLYLKIRKNTDLLKKSLMTMKLKEGAKFTDPLSLEYWETVPQILVDLRPKFESFVSGEGEVAKTQIEAQTIAVLNYLKYVNWERMYFDLCDYKQQKEYYNLYISKEKLKGIMEKNNYKVLQSFKNTLQNIITSIRENGRQTTCNMTY
jgi:type III restriction enzyme